MCKESETKQTTSLPSYVTDLGRMLTSRASSLAGNPGSVPLQGTADFSADQTNAFQKLRDLIAGAPQIGAETVGMARDYAKAPSQQVSTERVVDEGGKLGAMSDYINPNVDAALNPALRVIQEQADKQRKRIQAAGTSTGATRGGAFGDSQYNVVQGQNDRDTSLAMGETAAKVHSDAFDKAMAARTGDLNRFGATDVTNAQLNEQGLSRLMGGATGMSNLSSADQTRMLQQVQALMSSGGMQQGQEQTILNAFFNQETGQYRQPYEIMQMLEQALGSAAGAADKTTTTTQPDNSILGMLGALGGGVLGSKPVSTAIAGMI